MSLGPAFRKNLIAAVCTAFDERSLETVLRLSMDISLSQKVSTRQPFRYIVFDLIEQLEHEGRLEEFLQALRFERPKNTAFLTTVAETQKGLARQSSYEADFSPTLVSLRRKLFQARDAELPRILYEVEEYLASQPNSVDAKLIRDDLRRIISSQATRTRFRFAISAAVLLLMTGVAGLTWYINIPPRVPAVPVVSDVKLEWLGECRIYGRDFGENPGQVFAQIRMGPILEDKRALLSPESIGSWSDREIIIRPISEDLADLRTLHRSACEHRSTNDLYFGFLIKTSNGREFQTTHTYELKLPCDDLPADEGLFKGAFYVTGDMIAYAGPDNIWEVTQEKLSGANESIHIGVYDFSAKHVRDLLFKALERDAEVTILAQPGSAPASTADDLDEEELLDELMEHGATVVRAPRYSKEYYFTYHPKLIVVDGRWTLLQSANLTSRGVPRNSVGNREAGVAIDSKDLANYFIEMLRQDREKAERVAESSGGSDSPEPAIAFRAPDKLLPVLRLKGSAKSTAPIGKRNGTPILPVLVPDNYLDVVPRLLANARKSILIEQQYVMAGGPNVQKLLDSLERARVANLDVRFVVRRPVGSLAERMVEQPWWPRFRDRIRFLGSEAGRACSNRMIVVDGRYCLLGSANWSEAGVSKNRDVCLLIDSPELASWCSELFETDWNESLEMVIDNCD